MLRPMRTKVVDVVSLHKGEFSIDTKYDHGSQCFADLRSWKLAYALELREVSR